MVGTQCFVLFFVKKSHFFLSMSKKVSTFAPAFKDESTLLPRWWNW